MHQVSPPSSVMDQLERVKDDFKQQMCCHVDALFDIFASQFISRQVHHVACQFPEQITYTASQSTRTVDYFDDSRLNSRFYDSQLEKQAECEISAPLDLSVTSGVNKSVLLKSVSQQLNQSQLLHDNTTSESPYLLTLTTITQTIAESQTSLSDISISSAILDIANVKEEIIDEEYHQENSSVTKENILHEQQNVNQIAKEKNCKYLCTKRIVEIGTEDEANQRLVESPSKKSKTNTEVVPSTGGTCPPNQPLHDNSSQLSDMPNGNVLNFPFVAYPPVVTIIVPAENSAFTLTENALQSERDSAYLAAIKEEINNELSDESINNGASFSQTENKVNSEQIQSDLCQMETAIQMECNQSDEEGENKFGEHESIDSEDDDMLYSNELETDETDPGHMSAITPSHQFAEYSDDSLTDYFEVIDRIDPINSDLSSLSDISDQTAEVSLNSHNTSQLENSSTTENEISCMPTSGSILKSSTTERMAKSVSFNLTPEPCALAKTNCRDNKQMSRIFKPNRVSSSSESSDTGEHIYKSKKPTPVISNANSSKGYFDVIMLNIKCFEVHCDQIFENKRLHNQHLLKDHKLLPMICSVIGCGRSFHSKDELMQHAKEMHDDTQWQCGSCSMVPFHSFNSLCTHTILHHHLGRYKCFKKECSFEANIRATVIEHFHAKHPRVNKDQMSGERTLPTSSSSRDRPQCDPTMNPDKKYIYVKYMCYHTETNCQQVFEQLPQYSEHRTKVHKTLPIRCLANNCFKSFNTREEHEVHVNEVHIGPNEWICYRCGKRMRDYYGFYRHVYYRHMEGQFGCSYRSCHFEAKTRIEVIDHYDQTHLLQSEKCNVSSNLRTFDAAHCKLLHTKCFLCGEIMFTGLGNYNQHLKEKHDILPFRCLLSDCEKSYSTLDALQKHSIKDHDDKFQCPKCDRFFWRHSKLYTHWQVFHQEGKFMCTFPNCGSRFDFRLDVHQHYSDKHQRTTSK